MLKPRYHLHLDAAHLPPILMDRLLSEGGFQMDDFPHHLTVDGNPIPARHLTRYIYAPTSSREVQQECRKIQTWIQESQFKGLIQCEYVMEESQWESLAAKKGSLLPPLSIRSRPLDPSQGEKFKKHELHLELEKTTTSRRVIEALRASGFHILENETTISFTCCGHSRQMLGIRKAMKKFMDDYSEEITGKLTYEATAFWSLYGIESQTLPQIVDRVMVLQ
jgi:hypothetical protein